MPMTDASELEKRLSVKAFEGKSTREMFLHAVTVAKDAITALRASEDRAREMEALLRKYDDNK